MLLEFVADFLSENLANIPFGKMYAKPPKITEYVNSRLVNIKKTNLRYTNTAPKCQKDPTHVIFEERIAQGDFLSLAQSSPKRLLQC